MQVLDCLSHQGSNEDSIICGGCDQACAIVRLFLLEKLVVLLHAGGSGMVQGAYFRQLQGLGKLVIIRTMELYGSC